MLQALIKHKLKDSLSSLDLLAFKASEDSLTSSIFGVMQYLPEELFWDLLRRSCSSRIGLNEKTGDLNNIEFWPKWNAKNTDNTNYVEPDVFMQFDNFDLIIEAKKNDDYNQNGQWSKQWENEIWSYTNEWIVEGYDIKKDLHFIALGGNDCLSNTFVVIDEVRYEIHKASWQTLLNEIVKLKSTLSSFSYFITGNKQLIRLLTDLENAFNAHNIFCIEWFDSLKQFNTLIDEHSINVFASWTTNQRQFLSEINRNQSFNIRNTESIKILSKWKV